MALRRGAPLASDERGIAMLIVVLIMFIVTLIPVTIFAEDISAFPQAVHERYYLSALQAAESGVEDYISRLQSSPSYWQYSAGNPDNPENPAFKGWVNVPGTPTSEAFRYAVVNSQTPNTGKVWVISTGSAGPNHAVVRTVKVGLSERGFTSFLYVTNHEVQDPNTTQLDPQACAETAWQLNTFVGNGYFGPDLQGTWEAYQINGTWNWYYVPYCSYQAVANAAPTTELIQFGNQDQLNGRVESADEFHVCGTPQFPDGASSGYDLPTSMSGPNARYGGPGAYFDMSSLSGSASGTTPPSGATWNGHTYSSSTDRVKTHSYNYGGCNSSPTGPNGTPWSSASGQPSGAVLTFPTNNQDLEADTTADPQGGNPGGCSYQGPIQVTFSVGAGGAGLMSVTLASGSSVTYAPSGTTCSGNNLPLPPNGVIYDSSGGSGCTPNCQADVSVSGTVGGQVTVGSDNDITITGSLTYASVGTNNDVLGLSAANDVIVAQGLTGTQKDVNGNSFKGVAVEAAIYAGDSFYVSGYNSGSNLGTLYLYGSLAQNYRGAVGTGSGGGISTGYAKDYVYDSRLNFVQPPYFTAPANPPWLRQSFAECTPTVTPTASTC